MSRSGYCDDLDPLDLGRWRGWVQSAIRGKRGQAFLCEMRDALDAMPEKRLIAGDLVTRQGECCAMGAVCVARGLDASEVDPEDPEQVAALLGISDKMAQEISFENDEQFAGVSPELRWTHMRKWVERHIEKV